MKCELGCCHAWTILFIIFNLHESIVLLFIHVGEKKQVLNLQKIKEIAQ